MAASLAALIGATGLAAALLGSPAFACTVAEMFVSITLVVGLYRFIGNSGVLGFGHLGFMAMGAYATARLTMEPVIKEASLPALPGWLVALQWPGVGAMAAAAACGILLALVVGAVLVRLPGVAASIASFAFLAVVYSVASNWTDGTGGTAALIGVPGFASLEATAVVAALAIGVAALFDGSRNGLMLRAAREDEVAATDVGIRAHRVRLVGFAISAAVVAVAGSLHASYLGVVSPDAYFVDATFVALAMLVLGGLYTLEGAVLGTVALTAAKQLLIALEGGVDIGAVHLQIPRGSQELVIAALICAVLVKRPQGLASGLARTRASPRAAGGPAASPHPSPHIPTVKGQP